MSLEFEQKTHVENWLREVVTWTAELDLFEARAKSFYKVTSLQNMIVFYLNLTVPKRNFVRLPQYVFFRGLIEQMWLSAA